MTTWTSTPSSRVHRPVGIAVRRGIAGVSATSTSRSNRRSDKANPLDKEEVKVEAKVNNNFKIVEQEKDSRVLVARVLVSLVRARRRARA